MTREWNGSLVMEEFAKIAAESGLITTDFGKPIVGNSDRSPVGPFRNNPSVSGKTDTLSVDSNSKDYGVTRETGREVVETAHPKDPRVAESMGEGWMVENTVQRQEKDIGVATMMPSGALYGKHAELVGVLVSLANGLDGGGRGKAAARIDRAIGRIRELPFGSGLHKEAWIQAVLAPLKWLAMAGAAGGAWYLFGTKLTSLRENLSEDIQDLVAVASSVGEGQPAMSRLVGTLRSTLAPYVGRFRKPMPAPGQDAELEQYMADLNNFEHDLAKVSSIVGALAAVPDEWYKFGFGAKSRMREKLSDVQKTFAETMAAVKGMAEAGRRKMEAGKSPEPMAGKPGGSDIAEVQAVLAERGLAVPQSGKLDDDTRKALKRLERQLDTALRRDPKMAEILERRGWSVSGALARPDGTVVDPSTLRRLLALADTVGK